MDGLLSIQANRIQFFSAYVGDVPLVPGTALNRSLYQFCVQNREAFEVGETKAVHCLKPLQGKYLVIVNDVKGYNQMCEVQAYGNRGVYSLSLP